MIGFQSSVTLDVELVEPFIFLRNPPQWSVESTEQGGTGGCQLRGVVTIDVRKPGVRGNAVQIDLVGTSTSTDFINGAPVEEKEQFSRHITTLTLSNTAANDNEAPLSLGKHQLPFSITVPHDLPPTIDVEFGKVEHRLYASLLLRKQGQEGNKGGKVETLFTMPNSLLVRVLHDAAAANDQQLADDMPNDDPPVRAQTTHFEHANSLHCEWKTLNNWADIGSYVPQRVQIMPLQTSLSINSIRVNLQEVTSIRQNAGNKVQRSWCLLNVYREEPGPVLPFTAHGSSSLPMDNERMGKILQEAALRAQSMAAVNDDNDVKTTHACEDEIKRTAEATRMISDAQGPWTLAWDVQLPTCAKTRCSATVQHPRSPVKITHSLHLELDIEVPGSNDDGTTPSKPQKRRITMTLPYIIRSLYYTPSYAQLPCYYCAACIPHPYEARETRTEGGLLAYFDNEEPQSSTLHHHTHTNASAATLAEDGSSGSASCASDRTSASTLSSSSTSSNGSMFGAFTTFTSLFSFKSHSQQQQEQEQQPPAYRQSDGPLDRFNQTRQRVASQWLLLTSNHH